MSETVDSAECWTCRCCAGARLRSFAAPSWRTPDWPEYRLGECQDCRTINLIDAVDPGPFYEAYPQHRRAAILPSTPRRLLGTVAAQTLLRKNLLGRTARRLVRRPYWLRWFAGSDIRLSSPILDIGAGGGALLADLRRHGFSHLRGIDPLVSQSTVLDDGALQIDAVELDAYTHEGFSVCVLKHVLEHVDDPAALLTAAAARLAAGGLLVVEVPVAQGPVWEKYRDNWVALDPPVHRFVPTVDGMTHLVESVGLQIVRSWGETTMYHLSQSELIARRCPLDADPEHRDEVGLQHLAADLKRVRRSKRHPQMTFLLQRAEGSA